MQTNSLFKGINVKQFVIDRNYVTPAETHTDDDTMEIFTMTATLYSLYTLSLNSRSDLKYWFYNLKCVYVY